GPHVLEAVRFDPEGPREGDLAPGHRSSTDIEVTASPAPATCAESAPFSAVYLPDDWDPQLIPGSGSGDDLVCFGHWMGPDKSRSMTVMLASDAEHLRDGTGSAETFPDGSPLGEHRVLTYKADDGYVAFFEWEGEFGARLPLAIVGIGVTRE